MDLHPTDRRRSSGTSRACGSSRERKKRRWPRILAAVTLVCLVLVAAAGVVAYIYAQGLVDRFSSGKKAPVVAAARKVLNTRPRPVHVAHAVVAATAPAIIKKAAAPSVPTAPVTPWRPWHPPHRPSASTTGSAVQTFLLIGSDTRGGERGRSDTMILARLDKRRHTLSMLSIPRDLQVTIPGHGVDKINAAYSYGGPALAIATVRDTFDVVINHFVVIDFRGFQQVVAKLGGVYLPIDQRYHHVSSGTGSESYSSIDLEPGYQKLNGADALSWVRYRHGDSDFFRAARQQLFLRELKRQLGASGHLTSLPAVLGAAADSITSDVKSVRTVWNLVGALRSIPGDGIRRVVLDADGGLQGGVYYLVASEQQRRAAMAEWTSRSHAHPARIAPKTRAGSKRAAVGLQADTQAAALVRSIHPPAGRPARRR